MTGKQLRAIRLRIGLTQVEFADHIRMAGNSVTRMENGRMIITPPMELLIQYVAQEAGVEAPHSETGSRRASDKKPHGAKAGTSGRKGRRR